MPQWFGQTRDGKHYCSDICYAKCGGLAPGDTQTLQHNIGQFFRNDPDDRMLSQLRDEMKALKRDLGDPLAYSGVLIALMEVARRHDVSANEIVVYAWAMMRSNRSDRPTQNLATHTT